MSERIKLLAKYLRNGGLYPCNIFTGLVFECPEQVLKCIQSLDTSVCLSDRMLCNCYAQTAIDCDCLPMPLLNHFVYIISSFGKHFDLAKQIIEALIERGCDVNAIDSDIGSVLHSCICCIDNDIKLNASETERQLSVQCLDYLLSLNLCDLNLDVGYQRLNNALGTPLALAVDRELLSVVRKLIGVGVCVTKTTVNVRSIPDQMSEKSIQIFDLLFEAGLRLNCRLNANTARLHDKHNKYMDWIEGKTRAPLGLKSLARIVLRKSLHIRLNDKNLPQFLEIPKPLVVYLKFEDNINCLSENISITNTNTN